MTPHTATSKVEQRVINLEGQVGELEEKIVGLEGHIIGWEGKFAEMQQQLQALTEKRA